MTQYEVFDIYSNTFNAWIMLFTSYISIVFAFLVAATLAVDKLNRVLSNLAVILFSMASIFFIALTSVLGSRVVEQLAQLRAIEGRAPSEFASTIAVLASVILILTYFGSVFFFFYQRSLRKSAPLSDA